MPTDLQIGLQWLVPLTFEYSVALQHSNLGFLCHLETPLLHLFVCLTLRPSIKYLAHLFDFAWPQSFLKSQLLFDLPISKLDLSLMSSQRMVDLPQGVLDLYVGWKCSFPRYLVNSCAPFYEILFSFASVFPFQLLRLLSRCWRIREGLHQWSHSRYVEVLKLPAK